MSAKVTLGYGSRTDAVMSLRRLGLSTDEIANRIGIETKTVTALEHSALRSVKRKARPVEEHGRTILFPVDLLNRLAPHAARRGIHANRLARLIVETVVDEGLVDSVMDDADEWDGGKE